MSELRLVAVGKTGVGKSSFGNTVLNKKLFKASCKGSSVTTSCKLGDGNVNERRVSMVDTPGIKDTQKEKQDDIMKEIKRSIFLSAPGPHAICLIVQIGRFTQEDVDTLDEFAKHFGVDLFKFVIIVFTRYDDHKRECEEIETEADIYDYISTLPEDIQNFIEKRCGSRVLGFDNTLKGENSRKQVQELLVMVDKVIDDNRGQYYSNAELQAAEEIIQKAIDAERRQREQEMKTRIQNYRRKIEKEAEEKIKFAEQEKIALITEYEARMEEMNLRKGIKEKESYFDKFLQILPSFIGGIIGVYMSIKK